MRQIFRTLIGMFLLLFVFITCSKDDTTSEPIITITTYTLSTTSSPSDGGTTTPSSGKYDEGTKVSLKAAPNSNFVFENWTGGVSGTDNPINVIFNSNKSITAVFKLKDNDGDGVTDSLDSCSNTPSGETVDNTGCSESQKDDDGDGIMNDKDICPDTPSGEAVGDTGCSESQKDDDEDGIMNDKDTCLETPSGETVDETGCSESQKDDDDDGIMNDKDICSETPSDETVDETGCSESQKDDDGDGVMNDKDTCSDTPSGETADDIGCSESQKDDDGDGVMNDKDTCLDTPSGEAVDETGCSESQKDDDGDGIMNDIDACPNTPIGETVDDTGCIPDPKFSASKNSFNIGKGTIKDGFTIANTGGGILEWEYKNEGEYVTSSPTSGNISNKTNSNVVIRYDKTEVKIGTYNTTVNYFGNGEKYSFPLSVTKGFPEPESVYKTLNGIGDCYDLAFKKGDNNIYYSPKYNTGIAVLSGSTGKVLEYHSGTGDAIITGTGFAINNDDNLIYGNQGETFVVMDFNYNVLRISKYKRSSADLDYNNGSLFSIGWPGYLQRFDASTLWLQEELSLNKIEGLPRDEVVGFVSTDSNSLAGYILTDHIDSGSNSDKSKIIKIVKSGASYKVSSSYDLPLGFRVTGMALNPNNDHIYISARDRICLMVPTFYLD